MLSAKINNVARLLRMMADPCTISMPQKSVLGHAAEQLRAAAEEALMLEAAVVPKAQRLQSHHLEDGRVAMFPRAARPEPRP